MSTVGNKLLAVLGLLFFNCSAAGYYIISKKALNHGIDPLIFALVRDGGGAVVLMIAAGLLGVLRLPDKEDLFAFTMLGLTGVYFGQLLPIIALQEISPLNIALLQPAAPVFTYALSTFLGLETLALSVSCCAKVLGVFLAVSGSALVVVFAGTSSSGSGSALAGNIFVLLQVMMSAVYYCFQKPLTERYAPLAVAAWSYCFGAVTVVLGILPSGVLNDPSEWGLATSDVLPFAYAVLIMSATNYALLAFALKHLSPVVPPLMSTLNPVATAILASLFLGSKVVPSDIYGGCIILLGLWCFAFGKSREEAVVIAPSKDTAAAPINNDTHEPLLENDR